MSKCFVKMLEITWPKMEPCGALLGTGEISNILLYLLSLKHLNGFLVKHKVYYRAVISKKFSVCYLEKRYL